MLEDLIWVLERAFDRSGVFFIGELGEGQQHGEIVRLLSQRLDDKGIAVKPCDLGTTPTLPVQAFDGWFRQAKALDRQAVLAVWSLERLPEQQLKKTLRWFSASREWLSQQTTVGKVSIPVVLLVNRSMYRQYLARWAGDLLDCLLPPFELSLQ